MHRYHGSGNFIFSRSPAVQETALENSSTTNEHGGTALQARLQRQQASLGLEALMTGDHNKARTNRPTDRMSNGQPFFLLTPPPPPPGSRLLGRPSDRPVAVEAGSKGIIHAMTNLGASPRLRE